MAADVVECADGSVGAFDDDQGGVDGGEFFGEVAAGAGTRSTRPTLSQVRLKIASRSAS